MAGESTPSLDDMLAIAQEMPLGERVGRVFMFHLRNLVHAENLLRLKPAGFVRIYSDALTAVRQHAQLQRHAGYPLLLAADFEKGVAPVVSGATEYGPAMALAAAGEEQLTYAIARAIAAEASAIGINWNLMPTLDVNTEPRNPIINVRAFSDDPLTVVEHGRAFIKGSHDNGVLVCPKHFPGHGSTATDSHATLPVITLPEAELRKTHISPFAELIRTEHVEAVMVGHLVCPALDPSRLPATFSQRIIEQMLREELEFDGVVVSDALDMGALTRCFSTEEIVVRAFTAGCDLLLMPADPWAAYEALLRAVQDGTISEERLNLAVARVLRFATYVETRNKNVVRPDDTLGVVGNVAHIGLAEKLGRACITVIRGVSGNCPVSKTKHVAVISFSTTHDGLFEYLAPKEFGDYCEALHPLCRSFYCGKLGQERYDIPDAVGYALELCAGADMIVLGIYARIVVASGHIGFAPQELEFLARVLSLGKPVIVVLFAPPCLALDLPSEISNVICAFGSGWALQKAAAAAVFGRIPFQGKLPIRLE
jgi:beta-N-acetylhexosaminidase